MSQRVRCTVCQTAFITADVQPGHPVECPKCGAKHRFPAATALPGDSLVGSVFVPSNGSRERSTGRRRAAFLIGAAAILLLGVGALIAWPRLRPRPRPSDPVERVAEEYLRAITRNDVETQQRLSVVEEPPAIRSFETVRRDRGGDRTVKGSFAPLARLHAQITSQFAYDPAIARFTPRNPLGAAASTLDAVQAAKEKAEKSGLYDKMASGDPNDIFEAAESFGKVFTQLAEGALAPRKILPTYTMLVNEAKPPLAPEAEELGLLVGGNLKGWEALLKRPFHTLKADGPFILDRAAVVVPVIDQLGSLGDPPTPLRLSLVRFRLEGIDTGWRVIAAKRIVPGGEDEPIQNTEPSTKTPLARSPGDAAQP